MFECHVTIDPVPAARMELASRIAGEFKFKIANLLMQKRTADTAERCMYDTFMTGHSVGYNDLSARMKDLCKALTLHGFAVWRYKIEEILLDSRNGDPCGLLSTTSFPQPKESA